MVPILPTSAKSAGSNYDLTGTKARSRLPQKTQCGLVFPETLQRMPHLEHTNGTNARFSAVPHLAQKLASTAASVLHFWQNVSCRISSTSLGGCIVARSYDRIRAYRCSSGGPSRQAGLSFSSTISAAGSMGNVGRRRTRAVGLDSAVISQVMAEMGRKGGRIGGKRRLETMTEGQRKAVAQKAARARWGDRKRKRTRRDGES